MSFYGNFELTLGPVIVKTTLDPTMHRNACASLCEHARFARKSMVIYVAYFAKKCSKCNDTIGSLFYCTACFRPACRVYYRWSEIKQL